MKLGEKKFLVIAATIAAVVVLGWLIVDRFAFFQSGLQRGEVVQIEKSDGRNNINSNEEKVIPYRVEQVVSGLNTPWGIVFTSPTRMLVTERPGRLRIVENGVLQEKPLRTFSEVSATGEEGLMSVALDPQYDENQLLYLSLAYAKEKELVVKVVRFRDTGSELIEEKIIIDNIPAAQFHAGCRLAFGPDDKLYITTGDATNGSLAQKLDSLAGKILRLNSDGSIPSDNPFQNSPVWSYGHRNPQGISWSPSGQTMFETEHGPSVFDGPAGGDEVNIIVKGGNYGWPLVSHEKKRAGTEAPLLVYTPAEAPASALVYGSDVLPQFRNNLFFGALKGEGIVRIILDDKNPSKVVRFEKIEEVAYGRIRDVIQGPDGFIYFSTSNRDGRGTPASADDRIFRIRPQ